MVRWLRRTWGVCNLPILVIDALEKELSLRKVILKQKLLDEAPSYKKSLTKSGGKFRLALFLFLLLQSFTFQHKFKSSFTR